MPKSIGNQGNNDSIDNYQQYGLEQNELAAATKNQDKKAKRKSRGRSVSGSFNDLDRAIQDKPLTHKTGVGRAVSIEGSKSQEIDKFMEKLTDISMHQADISFIKQASVVTLLSFSLAAIVCVGFALALTSLWPLVVPLAVAAVLSGVLIKYLASSNDKLYNKNIATLIIKDFAENLIQEYPDGNHQQVLERLEQLTQSKEFDHQVRLFRGAVGDIFYEEEIYTPESEVSAEDKVSMQVTNILTTMFNYMEKDLPEDQKPEFMEAKYQYLLKLQAGDIFERVFEGFTRSNITKEITRALIENSDEIKQEFGTLGTAFEKGITNYIDHSEIYLPQVNTNTHTEINNLVTDTPINLEESGAVALEELNTTDTQLDEELEDLRGYHQPQETIKPSVNITPSNTPIKDNQNILKDLGTMLEIDTSDNSTETVPASDKNGNIETDDNDEFFDALDHPENEDELPKADTAKLRRKQKQDEFFDALEHLENEDELPKADTAKLRRKQKQEDFVANWSLVPLPAYNQQEKQNITSANKFLHNRDYHKIIRMINKKQILRNNKFKRDDNLLFFFANSDSYDNKKQAEIKRAIDILIGKNFGIDAQNSDGDTPLMVAIKTSNPYVASILLEKSDITIKNHNGEDALSLAKIHNDTQTQTKLEQLMKSRI